eukprot:scaffold15835_cov24-Tisochrysis_lutea.AAC.1
MINSMVTSMLVWIEHKTPSGYFRIPTLLLQDLESFPKYAELKTLTVIRSDMGRTLQLCQNASPIAQARLQSVEKLQLERAQLPVLALSVRHTLLLLHRPVLALAESSEVASACALPQHGALTLRSIILCAHLMLMSSVRANIEMRASACAIPVQSCLPCNTLRKYLK